MSIRPLCKVIRASSVIHVPLFVSQGIYPSFTEEISRHGDWDECELDNFVPAVFVGDATAREPASCPTNPGGKSGQADNTDDSPDINVTTSCNGRVGCRATVGETVIDIDEIG